MSAASPVYGRATAKGCRGGRRSLQGGMGIDHQCLISTATHPTVAATILALRFLHQLPLGRWRRRIRNARSHAHAAWLRRAEQAVNSYVDLSDRWLRGLILNSLIR